MEKSINSKIEQHELNFKRDIKNWLEDNCARVVSPTHENVTSDFIKYVYDHDKMALRKEDFQKRKRVKNVVEKCELCLAKRANMEQCTRRRHAGNEYCGTHCKGQPHGVISLDGTEPKSLTKVEVWVQDIKGINYYIDSENNVYRPEDIVTNKQTPAIIAKWTLTNGVYSIPSFGI